ncbi:hypothetical protein O3P69_016340 [Scylla paramamosain]|uniref:DDE Tnp4 domain-containing protein n=1 Tax=Scylla paramamosain TaxID=85552 RepID=A0AAW0TDN9_SCYPA
MGIGQLKRCFHILHSEIQVDPLSRVCQIVKVYALLHNIYKTRDIILPEEKEDFSAEDGDNDEQPPVLEVQHHCGLPPLNSGTLLMHQAILGPDAA